MQTWNRLINLVPWNRYGKFNVCWHFCLHASLVVLKNCFRRLSSLRGLNWNERLRFAADLTVCTKVLPRFGSFLVQIRVDRNSCLVVGESLTGIEIFLRNLWLIPLCCYIANLKLSEKKKQNKKQKIWQRCLGPCPCSLTRVLYSNNIITVCRAIFIWQINITGNIWYVGVKMWQWWDIVF